MPPEVLIIAGRVFMRVEERVLFVTRLAAGVDVDLWASDRLGAFMKADGR